VSLETGPVRYGSPRLAALIEEIGAGALEREENDEPPFAAIAAVKAARLGALRVPRERGGGGATLTEVFEVFIDLAEADSNVAHILRIHFGIVEGLLRWPGPGAELLLERVVRGELFGSAGTELTPQAGNADYPLTTTIEPTAAGHRLNGVKIYSTGNLYTDWLVVTARGEDGANVRLVIPSDRPGVEFPDDWDGIGQRFTGSGTTVFRDVAVEPGDHFPEVTPSATREGGTAAPWRATFFHIQLNAMIAGILRRVVRDSVEVASSRPYLPDLAGPDLAGPDLAGPVPDRAGGSADDPLVHYGLGLLASQAFAAEALTLAAGAAFDAATRAAGTAQEYELSLQATLKNAKAKVIIDDLALRAASDLFDLGDLSVVGRGLQLDRHWRNIRTIAAHNPKTLKAATIGKYALTGTPPPHGGFF
jgi:alkylation response protein AidB-like acyl-CoA dehydrogenase